MRPLAGAIVALCFAAGVSLQFTLAEVGNLAQEIWPLGFDELARRYRMMTPTTWWGGMAGTGFWVDPEAELIAVFMIQNVMELNHALGFREDVYDALGR